MGFPAIVYLPRPSGETLRPFRTFGGGRANLNPDRNALLGFAA